MEKQEKVMDAEEFREWIEKRYGDKEQIERPKSDIEILSEIRSEYNCFDEEEEQKYRALSDAIQALNSLKHGEWINCKCSICQQDKPLERIILRGKLIWETKPVNYCPNCGAKMDGAEDE